VTGIKVSTLEGRARPTARPRIPSLPQTRCCRVTRCC